MTELQAIVDALNGLGEDAKAAFIVWICAKYAVMLCIQILITGTLITVVWFVARTVRYCVGEFWDDVKANRKNNKD